MNRDTWRRRWVTTHPCCRWRRQDHLAGSWGVWRQKDSWWESGGSWYPGDDDGCPCRKRYGPGERQKSLLSTRDNGSRSATIKSRCFVRWFFTPTLFFRVWLVNLSISRIVSVHIFWGRTNGAISIVVLEIFWSTFFTAGSNSTQQSQKTLVPRGNNTLNLIQQLPSLILRSV